MIRIHRCLKSLVFLLNFLRFFILFIYFFLFFYINFKRIFILTSHFRIRRRICFLIIFVIIRLLRGVLFGYVVVSSWCFLFSFYIFSSSVFSSCLFTSFCFFTSTSKESLSSLLTSESDVESVFSSSSLLSGCLEEFSLGISSSLVGDS